MNTRLMNLLAANPAAVDLLMIKGPIADRAIAAINAVPMTEPLETGGYFDMRAMQRGDDILRDALRQIGIDAVQDARIDTAERALELCEALQDARDKPDAGSSPRDLIVIHEAARIADAAMAREIFGF